MLSILMPVYNERERVEEAIAEVLATELPTDFELIIVDDGSTDGTREILRNGDWGERVRLFHSTFQTPKRVADLEGGSLYWVIKGTIQVRQRLWVPDKPSPRLSGMTRRRAPRSAA